MSPASTCVLVLALAANSGALGMTSPEGEPPPGNSAEKQILQASGFSETAASLIMQCPLHVTLAERLELLHQLGAPLNREKVKALNEQAHVFRSGLFTSDGILASMFCEKVVQDLGLPVTQAPVSNSVIAREQLKEDKAATKGEWLKGVAGLVLLGFTIIAVTIERRWRARQARLLRVPLRPGGDSEGDEKTIQP
jgi:hypothetical protein